MKKAEVEVGKVYIAKVSGRLVRVRIDSIHHVKGWMVTNLATNRVIHCVSATRRPARPRRNGCRRRRADLMPRKKLTTRAARRFVTLDVHPDGSRVNPRAEWRNL